MIVGSGPVGSTFARILSEERPSARVLLVEAGPQLTPVPGVHVKNIVDEHERVTAQVRSQGPASEEAIASVSARAGMPLEQGTITARAGTAFVDPRRAADVSADTLPAAAMSTNVGGMAAHWTCACPHPYGSERIEFIRDPEWDALVAEARRLLAVTTAAFPRTRQGVAILRTLSGALDHTLPEGRKVQPMPLACRVDAGGARHWTGTDVVLGPLAVDPPETFVLRSETLCRRLLVEGDRVIGAELEDRRSGSRYAVRARAFAVACDSFRTPQLLWASGIRPRSLGHYLNDHVQLMGGVRLDEELVARATADLPPGSVPDAAAYGDDPMVGVFWVPFADDAHPFHAQVMHWDMSPLKLEGESRGEGHVVAIGAMFGKVDVRFDDCVSFSDAETDLYGMPRISIAYRLTERDLAHVDEIKGHQAVAAAAFGGFAPGRGPRTVPPGTSLHFQGTVRIGETNDGASVADGFARVWGLRNLFVGGNGVIPTVTSGNPTLTSVAIAVRSARALAADL